MKKVLMLGGSTVQVAAIKKAKEMGLYVIVCDYLPDNPGQYVADEYYPTSTTDQEAVLELARKVKPDGIICYATDAAAPTAAYVCEKLGLPSNPYESVKILSNKDLYRTYLRENGFCTPQSGCYTNFEELYQNVDQYAFPIMVKPVDSSGSKGVNKVYQKNELQGAFQDALKYTRCGRIIVEEFVEKKGYQISGDGFSVDGKLVFRCFGNEFYGSNGIKEYVPLGECWPSVLPADLQEKVHNEIQRLITSLGMKTCAYNIEAILDRNDNVYIMELGARSGGSLIPQITQMATGVDLVEYVIKAALGESCEGLRLVQPNGFWSNYMVHSRNSGILKKVSLDKELEPLLVDYVSDKKPGALVTAFENSNQALGTMVFRYTSMEQMLALVKRLPELVQVELE